jgi:hypothetical protein
MRFTRTACHFARKRSQCGKRLNLIAARAGSVTRKARLRNTKTSGNRLMARSCCSSTERLKTASRDLGTLASSIRLHFSCALLVASWRASDSAHWCAIGSGISRAHRLRTRQTPAPDLITKQKHRQAEQECARQDEQKQIHHIKHFEMTPMSQTHPSSMVMGRELMSR